MKKITLLLCMLFLLTADIVAGSTGNIDELSKEDVESLRLWLSQQGVNITDAKMLRSSPPPPFGEYIYKSDLVNGRQGYVDLARLLDEYTKTADFEKALAKKANENEVEHTGLLNAISRAKGSEHEALMDELKRFEVTRRSWLVIARCTLLTNLFDAIRTEVEFIGSVEGYSSIINSRGGNSSRAVDLTSEVSKKLNTEYNETRKSLLSNGTTSTKSSLAQSLNVQHNDSKAEEKERKKIEKEKRKRARKLGIGNRLLTLCPRCRSIVYLEQLEALDMYDGVKSRQVVCGGCGNEYDIADGIDYYNEYANRVKAQNAAIAMQAMSNAMLQSQAQQQYESAKNQQILNLVSHRTFTSPTPFVNNNSYTANSIGSFDYVSGTGGYSGTGQRIGNFYYYNDNKGGRYTAQKIGNFDYVSGGNGYSGSGQNIGNSYYYNDNQGGRYNAQSVGNFDYVYGSDGYSGSGQQIGDSYYYRDNK